MLHGTGFYFVANVQAETSHPQTLLPYADRCEQLLVMILLRNQSHQKEEPENEMLRNWRLPLSAIHHYTFSFLILQCP